MHFRPIPRRFINPAGAPSQICSPAALRLVREAAQGISAARQPTLMKSEIVVTDEDQQNEGAKREDVVAALRGWGLVVAMVVVVFGATYSFISMTE
jgi:hypothetical protein